MNCDIIIMDECNSLGCCDVTDCMKAPTPQVVNKQYDAWCQVNQLGKYTKKGTTPMRYDNVAYAVAAQAAPVESDLSKARKYLATRIDDVIFDKKLELKKTFGLTDDKSPETFTDFLARIQAGKYVYPEEKKDKPRFDTWSIVAGIRWRDPAVKEDMEGYEAAKVLLKAAAQDALDVIRVSSEADGLAALKDFQSKTFH